MRKPSWIWWETAASLLHIFAWVSMLPFGWRVVAEWFVAFFWLTTSLGTVGLIVLLIAYKSSIGQADMANSNSGDAGRVARS